MLRPHHEAYPAGGAQQFSDQAALAGSSMEAITSEAEMTAAWRLLAASPEPSASGTPGSHSQAGLRGGDRLIRARQKCKPTKPWATLGLAIVAAFASGIGRRYDWFPPAIELP